MKKVREFVKKLSALSIGTGWFLSVFIPANMSLIAFSYFREIAGCPTTDFRHMAIVNLPVLWLYFRKGRSALSRIPLVAISTALLTITCALYLSHPPFQLISLESIYRVAQLFVGESAWVDKLLQDIDKHPAGATIEVLFDIGRMAALVFTVSGVLAISRRLLDWAKVNLKFGGWREHTVVCGLGEAGMEFVKLLHTDDSQKNRKHAKSLLIVERDETNPNVETARNIGAAVLVGDIFSADVQVRARVSRAETIILMLPDDKRNIELALEFRKRIERARKAKRFGSRRRKPTKLLIHVDDTRLARRLQDHSRAGIEECTETRFFDFYESSARALLSRHPLDVYAEVQRAEMAHLAIYGLGQMGEAVLRQAVRQTCFPGGQGLLVTIFDQRVSDRDFVAGFWRANAGLKRLQEGDWGYQPLRLKIRFLKLNDARCGINLKRLYESVADSTPAPTQHVICFDEDALGAAFAMNLRDTLRDRKPLQLEGRTYSWDAPIFVRLQRRHGLARLFLEVKSGSNGESDTALETPDSLFAFGMLDDIVEPTELISAHRDDLARILHSNGYRKTRRMQRGGAAQNIWRKQTEVPWEHLPLHYKSSNRAQADHIEVKLRGLRHTVAEPSIGAAKKSLARPGVACFEPIDRIFCAGESSEIIVTVQRIYSQLPVVTCWEPGNGGELTARQVPSNVGELDDWAEEGKRFGWGGVWFKRRKAMKEVKTLQNDLKISDISGPRDHLLNRDSSNNAKVVQVDDNGPDSNFSLCVRDRSLLRLTTNGIKRPIERSTHDAWPWIVAVMQSNAGKGAWETFLTVWNVRSVNSPVEPCTEKLLTLPVISVDRTKVALEVTKNANENVCGVVWWTEAPAEGSDAPDDSRRVSNFSVFVIRRTSLAQLRTPSGIDLEYKPVALQLACEDKYLLLALRRSLDTQTPSARGQKSRVLILCWKIYESSETSGEPADPFLTEVVLKKDACKSLMLEVAEVSGGKIRIFAATAENELLVLGEAGAVSKVKLNLHSSVTALSLLYEFADRSPVDSNNASFALAVGCRDSDLLCLQIDEQSLHKIKPGSAIKPRSIAQLAHPWMRTLRSPHKGSDYRGLETVSADQWEIFSRIEHDRWSVFNYLEGWRYGKPRVDIARVHDNLVPWEKLSPEIQQYDAAHIAKIPLFLDRLGRQKTRKNPKTMLCREIRIGIVGHRPHRLKSHLEWLSGSTDEDGGRPSVKSIEQNEIDRLAEGILTKFAVGKNDLPVKFILVTSLAEGADRLIAKALLESKPLNAQMDVLFPLPWEIYLKTFSKEDRKQSVDQFLHLIRHPKTRKHFQLPLLHGSLRHVDDLKSENDKCSPQQKQFQLANAWVVQNCDYLIAAWDGKEIGGNPAVLSQAGLKEKLMDLPSAGKESSYTEDAKPGGTWEAIRWWLDPTAIPESMQWPSHWNPICAANEPPSEDRLFLFGAGVTVAAAKSGEEQ